MWVWVIFAAIVSVSFFLDVGLCNKDKSANNLTIKQALVLSLIWILTAFAFNVGLYYSHGSIVALEFLASYLLEKGLSVDNVFVFYIIFEQFQVPERYQRRVLQWGTRRIFTTR
jgi:tellurite resistance protein TerC